MLKPKKDYFTDKMLLSDYTSARIVKIPFEKADGWSLDHKFRLYKENDLNDDFVLYIPENKNV